MHCHCLSFLLNPEVMPFFHIKTTSYAKSVSVVKMSSNNMIMSQTYKVLNVWITLPFFDDSSKVATDAFHIVAGQLLQILSQIVSHWLTSNLSQLKLICLIPVLIDSVWFLGLHLLYVIVNNMCILSYFSALGTTPMTNNISKEGNTHADFRLCKPISPPLPVQPELWNLALHLTQII